MGRRLVAFRRGGAEDRPGGDAEKKQQQQQCCESPAYWTRMPQTGKEKYGNDARWKAYDEVRAKSYADSKR